MAFASKSKHDPSTSLRLSQNLRLSQKARLSERKRARKPQRRRTGKPESARASQSWLEQARARRLRLQLPWSRTQRLAPKGSFTPAAWYLSATAVCKVADVNFHKTDSGSHLACFCLACLGIERWSSRMLGRPP